MRRPPIYLDDKDFNDYSSYLDSDDWERTTTLMWNEMVTSCQCSVCQQQTPSFIRKSL